MLGRFLLLTNVFVWFIYVNNKVLFFPFLWHVEIYCSTVVCVLLKN